MGLSPDDIQIERFKRDLVITMISTSGILLTVCLMVLIVLVTATTPFLMEQKERPLVIVVSLLGASTSILVACLFFIACVFLGLRTLHVLIWHVSSSPDEEKQHAEQLLQSSVRLTAQCFILGLISLVVAIVFAIVMLSAGVLTPPALQESLAVMAK